MTINLTRFYLDIDEESRTGCLNQAVFEDIETFKADEYEQCLQQKEIVYIRVDL